MRTLQTYCSAPKSTLFLLLAGLLACLLSSCRDNATAVSPDGSVRAQFFLDPDGSPYISVKVDRKEVLTISNIGFTTSDSLNLNSGFHLADEICCTRFDDTATLLWGENKVIESHYENRIITLANDDSVKMMIEMRVFDDGMAYNFQYLYPDSLVLTGESTIYRFAHDGLSWSIPANFESYEFAYREQPISQTADANTPFTFHIPACGIYGSLHEAALYDMPEMTLVRDSSDSLLFHTRLAPDNSGSGSVASVEGFPESAWRTLILGRSAVDLINSSLILNCNYNWDEICHTADYAWARPLKYIGIWWSMHLGINSWTPDNRHGATTANALRYIDFASENNIDAVLFEGWNQGWEQWGGTQEFDFVHAAPDFDVERIIAYAQEKGVRIIMHHETGGNLPHYEGQMEHAFRWCQEHGIHYIKTGYAGGFPNRELHHSQYGVKHYQRVVQCAADHQIALDVHEPIKPTGLCRTYPNLMTGEGARGMEWNAWSDGNSPAHTTILPFTRLLAGPMDYTPGIFDITYQRI
ncbi:MAG: glycoside hydrolase family 97 catalytic domain-containing protein, partial [Bacteroidales bacterium]|nr:glycoside hydrolase family 97 catalytic domain-containing protein [Bacteroidales bacterium]